MTMEHLPALLDSQVVVSGLDMKVKPLVNSTFDLLNCLISDLFNWAIQIASTLVEIIKSRDRINCLTCTVLLVSGPPGTGHTFS